MMNIIQMPCSKDSTDFYVIDGRSLRKHQLTKIILTAIDENEENKLDSNKPLNIIRKGQKFYIEPSDIFCYGEVDFSSTSRDFAQLATFPIIFKPMSSGKTIVSNYCYKTHSCTSPKKFPLTYETWNPAKVCQYAHAWLNKPKRILLFKTETYGH